MPRMTPPPSAADEELEDVAEERPVAPPNRTLSRHEFHLVYPFKTECRDIDSLTRWENYTERLDKEKLEREEHDSYAFLPHARSSHYNRFANDPTNGSAMLARGYRDGTSSIRLTLRKHEYVRYCPKRATVFRADKTHFTIDIDVSWVDVILYPPGFGFLIYKISTTGLTVEDAGVVHRSIKKVYYRERLRVNPPRLHIIGRLEEEWPTILSGLLSDFDVDTASEYAQTHASSFRVVSLAIGPELANDELVYGNIRGSEEGHLLALITGEDLSTISHPGNDLVEIARTTGRLNYWRDWSGLFLWDDVAFIGTETQFTTTHLVHNVEALYTPLFVYALFQHLRLNEISVSLTQLSAEARARGNGVLKKLENLNADLRFFRSNYMFWEISRQPVMAALFGHLVTHFETVRQFDQIEHDIERMYLQERTVSQERLAFFVGLATFFALPVGALLAAFGGSVSSFLSASWMRWLLMFAVVGISLLGWLLATNRLSIPPRIEWPRIRRRAMFGQLATPRTVRDITP